jgi:molybdopterin converting factor small subunit
MNTFKVEKRVKDAEMHCTVEMFGLSPQITDINKVELELKEGAGLKDLVAALRRKIPALEGSVIKPGEDRLTDWYVFSINGQFQDSDSEIRLRSGDRITLLLLATGG